MALEVPESAVEVDQRMKTDVSRSLPNSNPFLPNSWISAIVTAAANRIFDFYFALRRAELEAIPDTAVLRLEQWAAIYAVLRIAATTASGRLALTGAVTGAVITGTTKWVSSTGKVYTATETGTITLQSLSVATITESGGVATLTTDNDHMLASNVLITVSGANQAEYNLSNVVCTVTGAKILTYAVAGSPADMTGTTLLGFTSLSVNVQSDDFGTDQNQLFDTVLTLQSPIVNIDDDARADFEAITGGADQETDVSLRERMIEKIQNPISHFNVAEITSVAKAVPGVTRVFVQEITPTIGETTIYFMRDNDTDSVIPDAGEVADVKAAIDAIKPANADTLDIIVLAPIAEQTDYIFTAILPNTATMKTAIENSLKQFYAERPEVGVNIVEEAYNAAIFNTVDPVTGEDLISFTLSAPVGDIVIDSAAPAEIGTLGNVTF